MIKKFICALTGVLMSVPVFAQYGVPSGQSFAEERGLYYGLRLGLSMAAVGSDAPELDAGTLECGLHVGAVIGFLLSPENPVILETGLSYVEKGGKGDYEDKIHTYSLRYLELPVVVKYRYDLDGDFSIQPFGGGYMAVGVGGKIKNYTDRVYESSFSGDNFRRFDGGLRFGCGFEFQNIYADVCFDLGLTNICHSQFDSSHTRCLYINAGVNF